MLIYTLVMLIIFSASWAFLFPRQAAALIAELRRKLRLRVIHRTGTDAAKDIAQELHEFAQSKGMESEMVDEVLAEHHEMIVERVGRRCADDILGEADPTERYY